tara:strand:+ start:325 stop:603 length:279 start_codon:yes stop_codon:yes gene_type:complete
MPVVSEEVIKSIVRDLEAQYNEVKEVETLNHLIEFWREFKIAQPALSALLLKELQSAKGRVEKGYIAHGAWVVYKALKVQEEVDDMNQAWGE